MKCQDALFLFLNFSLVQLKHKIQYFQNIALIRWVSLSLNTNLQYDLKFKLQQI